jgi:hypothetical protein
MADTVFDWRLAVLLDAKLEQIVMAFEQADLHVISQQVDGLLRDVGKTHLDQPELLAAAGKSCSTFDTYHAKRDDCRAEWTYRLPHSQGWESPWVCWIRRRYGPRHRVIRLQVWRGRLIDIRLLALSAQPEMLCPQYAHRSSMRR